MAEQVTISCEEIMKYNVKRHAVVQPLDPSIRLIPLTQDQNAVVDAADYEWLNQWNWVAYKNPHTQTFYASRRPSIHMHRVIMGAPQGVLVDHKNHDTLDNRRSNLRLCTNQQNQQNRRLSKGNTSGFKGVSWHRGTKKWAARIRVGGKQKTIGYFSDPKEAANAYVDWAEIHHKEFAMRV